VVDESIRRQLCLLARRKECRRTGVSSPYPGKWRPWTLIDPATDEPFTEAAAWELIAARLEGGEELTEVILENPPGRRAYSMEFLLPNDPQPLYVKLQLGPGTILGRSFHPSEHRRHRPQT
jgi:hypothetical protein